MSLDPIQASLGMAPSRPKREIQRLFSTMINAATAVLEPENDDEHTNRKLQYNIAFEDTVSNAPSQQWHRNQEIVRVALLSLGALGAAVGKLWQGAVKGAIVPYLGMQVCVILVICLDS